MDVYQNKHSSGPNRKSRLNYTLLYTIKLQQDCSQDIFNTVYHNKLMTADRNPSVNTKITEFLEKEGRFNPFFSRFLWRPP